MVDWMKLLHTSPRNPKLRVLMRELGCNRFEARGLAWTWLLWVDEQTTDGRTGLLPVELDDEIGREGLADALCACGWARVDEQDGTVCAVDFGKHCGETAKKRADGARRKALCLDRKRGQEQESVTEVTKNRYQDVTEVTENTLPEEEVEEEVYNKGGSGSIPLIQGAAATATAAPTRKDLTDEQQVLLRSEEFDAWFMSLREAVPALKRLRFVPSDAWGAAADAFKCVPDAAGLELQPMIQRYYAAKKADIERRGVKVYRPNGVRAIFSALHDIVEYASEFCEREDRVKAAIARRKRQEGEARAAAMRQRGQPEEEMSEEERVAMWRDCKGE